MIKTLYAFAYGFKKYSKQSNVCNGQEIKYCTKLFNRTKTSVHELKSVIRNVTIPKNDEEDESAVPSLSLFNSNGSGSSGYDIFNMQYVNPHRVSFAKVYRFVQDPKDINKDDAFFDHTKDAELQKVKFYRQKDEIIEKLGLEKCGKSDILYIVIYVLSAVIALFCIVLLVKFARKKCTGGLHKVDNICNLQSLPWF